MSETPSPIPPESTDSESTGSIRPDNTPTANEKDTTLATICHLLGLAGYLGIPLGSVIAPLILWLIKKDEDPFLRESGKRVLNFQISMTLYAIVATLSILLVVGVFLLPVLLILGLVYTIIGAIKASDGVLYEYPLTIRFLR